MKDSLKLLKRSDNMESFKMYRKSIRHYALSQDWTIEEQRGLGQICNLVAQKGAHVSFVPSKKSFRIISDACAAKTIASFSIKEVPLLTEFAKLLTIDDAPTRSKEAEQSRQDKKLAKAKSLALVVGNRDHDLENFFQDPQVRVKMTVLQAQAQSMCGDLYYSPEMNRLCYLRSPMFNIRTAYNPSHRHVSNCFLFDPQDIETPDCIADFIEHDAKIIYNKQGSWKM